MAEKKNTKKVFRSYLSSISLKLVTPFGEVILPSKHSAPKNIAFIEQEVYDFLTDEVKEGEPFAGSKLQFKELVLDEIIKELDKVPESYYDATERVAEATAKVEEATKATEEAKAENELLTAENEALRKKLADAGIK